MKNRWSEMSSWDKIMLVMRILLSAIVIVMAGLQLSGVWKEAINYAIPFLGLYHLILGIQELKRNRDVGILGICVAVFIVVVSCVVFFGR